MSGRLLPHHDGSERHVADLSPALGAVVPITVVVPPGFDCTRLWVRTTPDAEPSYAEGRVVATTVEGTWWQADLAVRNPVTAYRFALEGGPHGHRWLNGAGVFDHDVPDVDDFRLTTYAPPPPWLAEAVAYQVFPDRFASSGRARHWPSWARVSAWDDPVASKEPTRQVYGGDLAGVEVHLDHIGRLGANLLYLTPFFPAESSHRYDAATFEHVDPLLGGDEALASLVAAAHRRGMRVLGDITANHSGRTHAWFRAAQADASSPEASFYVFRHHPDDYEAWFGVRTLPKFDLRSPELRRRLLEGSASVVGRFLGPEIGLDGWRVDVANMAGRLGDVDVNRDVAATMRATMAAVRPDAYLVAEHCHDAHADLLGDGWHGTMNYAGFTDPVWRWLAGPEADRIRFSKPLPVHGLPGDLAATTMRAFGAVLPWRTRLANLNLLDSHDTARFRTIAGSRERAIAGVGLLMTYPGVPMVFAGDEVGLEGASSDQARVPMSWDEARWDGALYGAYRDLIGLRRSSEALQRGGLRWRHAGADVLVYERASRQERLLVQVSRADHDTVFLDRLGLCTETPTLLYGPSDLVADGAALALPNHGPAVHVWRLDP